MEFDWNLSVDKYCEKLCDIALGLLSMAGIRSGRTVETLPKHRYLAILAILRPAEFAARRIIAMAAAKLVNVTVLWTEARKTPANKPPRLDAVIRPSGSVILGPEPRTHSVMSETDTKIGTEPVLFPIAATLRLRKPDPEANPGAHPSWQPSDTAPVAPAFVLFDPFKHFGEPWMTPEQIARQIAGEAVYHDRFPGLLPDKPIDARTITRRIRALADALMKLEHQALRLARWRARSRAGLNSKPVRFGPLRPGRPPGYTRKPKTDLECVLKDCHVLAHDAWDTS